METTHPFHTRPLHGGHRRWAQAARTNFHFERTIDENYGLDFQQIYALQHLRRNPNTRLTDIAAEMELPKFTVSRLLNGLVNEGYISKNQNSADRRNYHLNMEEKGEQVLLAIETASFTRISTNVQTLSPETVNNLVEVADRLPMVLGVTDKIKDQ